MQTPRDIRATSKRRQLVAQRSGSTQVPVPLRRIYRALATEEKYKTSRRIDADGELCACHLSQPINLYSPTRAAEQVD